MARITEADLQDVFDTSLNSSSLSQWIDIASGVVDDIAAQDESIGSSRLEQIELMLAAHYASTQDPRIESASAETRSVEYKSTDYATDYYATAVGLDPTGTVDGLTKPNASVTVPDIKDLPE